MKKSICRLLLAAAALIGMAEAASAQFTLTNGDIIGIDTDFGANHLLRKYSPGGVLLQSLAVTGLPNRPGALTIHNNQVFVIDAASNVRQVDLTTGAASGGFNAGVSFLESMSSNGTNFFFTTAVSGLVREFTPTGTPVGTFTLQATGGSAGMDGLPNQLFALRFGDGNIGTYDYSGTLLNSIPTGFGSATTGVAFEAESGSFWVSTGFGDNRYRRYSSAGAITANFAVVPNIMGIDMVSVPEPTTLALLGLALGGGGAAAWRRWRKRKEEAAIAAEYAAEQE